MEKKFRDHWLFCNCLASLNSKLPKNVFRLLITIPEYRKHTYFHTPNRFLDIFKTLETSGIMENALEIIAFHWINNLDSNSYCLKMLMAQVDLVIKT